LAGSVLLMAIRTSEPTWRTHTHLLVVSTFMALAFLPLLAWNAMTLPLPWTQVCATKTVAGAEGWLVGQAGDTLLLGSGAKPRHILIVPSKDTQILEINYVPGPHRPYPICPPVPATG